MLCSAPAFDHLTTTSPALWHLGVPTIQQLHRLSRTSLMTMQGTGQSKPLKEQMSIEDGYHLCWCLTFPRPNTASMYGTWQWQWTSHDTTTMFKHNTRAMADLLDLFWICWWMSWSFAARCTMLHNGRLYYI